MDYLNFIAAVNDRDFITALVAGMLMGSALTSLVLLAIFGPPHRY